jgi:Co/Zn/Cd efflux system component
MGKKKSFAEKATTILVKGLGVAIGIIVWLVIWSWLDPIARSIVMGLLGFGCLVSIREAVWGLFEDEPEAKKGKR